MKKIAVITGTRADYGLLHWILKEIDEDTDLELRLIVTGMHLSQEFGLTIKEIEKDGFKIDEKVEMLLSSDTGVGIAKSIGLGVIGFADVLERLDPDILLVLGDRFEIFAACTAAMALNIPIAHIAGGESTEGVIDEQIRHAITKMSHIHFPSIEFYAKRIRRMGEEDWRVFVVGGTGLDHIKRLDLMTKDEIERVLDIKIEKPTLLVTYHPVTLESEDTDRQVDELLRALEETGARIIFTYPNAEVKSREIIKKIKGFVLNYPKAKIFINLGQRRYLSLLKYVDVMIGNSSSGIIEAPSFELPVVNIGNRQKGRIRARNVIDVGYTKEEIIKGIDRALDKGFKRSLKGLKNPYGNGDSSKRIVDVLKSIEIDDRLLKKRFSD
ncbi:MAG: UDP-N-acetylglucosamine 2-epimerase [bacterium]|nr:UDP-N-acetylglucosamine 2-epimerase [bacterium]